MSGTLERHAEFEARMMALIGEFSDLLAPHDCKWCGRDDSCPHSAEEAAVEVDGVMPADYLLIHRWVRMDGQGGYWAWQTANSLMMLESIGILTAVLDDARDRVRR